MSWNNGWVKCLIGVLVIIRDLAKLYRTVQTWRFFTWKCILRIVTSQSFLIKHCGISAEETPFGCLNHISIIVFDWKTDVENLLKKLYCFNSHDMKWWTKLFIPDIHSEHQHSIHIPDPHRRRYQSMDTGGCPHFRLGGHFRFHPETRRVHIRGWTRGQTRVSWWYSYCCCCCCD